MKPVDSTYKILAYKVLNRSVDEEWVSWAQEMLMAGFETEHLVILAGETPFFNQFEMKSLTDKVFEELNLSYADTIKVMKAYVYFLVNEAIIGKASSDFVLSMIYDISFEDEFEILFQDFRFLHWAKGDLDYSDQQYYWPSADRNNIDEVIMNYFKEWMKNYENANT